MSLDTSVKYSPFSSYVDPSFWHKLCHIKLEVDRLNEKSRPIWGSYSNINTVNLPSLHVDCTSFNSDFEALHNLFPASGHHLNVNTLESFKDHDKNKLLQEQGSILWHEICSGAALQNPSLLSRFFLLTFGDLKKYNFYYWFAFLAPSSPIAEILEPPVPLSSVFTSNQIMKLEQAWNNIVDIKQRGYFMVKLEETSFDLIPLKEIQNVFHDGNNHQNIYLAFADPCPSGEHPGWPLRNLLSLLLHFCPHVAGKQINILSLRFISKSQATVSAAEKSFIISVKARNTTEPTVWVGWERNSRGKFGPRSVNVSSTMDPKKRAEGAVDLNLKLMKWRLLPDLDLEVLGTIRCLVVGAGTLGCSVARTLMGWGVKNITLVDNGHVSFSNPVRQSLFTLEDCLNGGKPKAETAAKALQLIHPGVNSNGVHLHIPMPGHTVGDSLMEETRQAVRLLEKLVDDHDAVFLLTDSRESRWLPTMLCCSKNKITLNAALGFDSYLVMRHGVCCGDVSPPDETPHKILGRNLGCYFCNDVTAPGNSMLDRTLDQQCTVTRPGVSAIAAALAVELMVSILQHPSRGDAPAFISEVMNPNEASAQSSLLGTIPHSIRGFLSSWEQFTPATHRFNKCIACSEQVLKEYSSRGFDFIIDVLNSTSYLEDLTGLTSLLEESETADVWELSDSEEENKT